MTTPYLFILAVALTAIASASAHRSTFLEKQAKSPWLGKVDGLKYESRADAFSTVAVLLFVAAILVGVAAVVSFFQ